MFLFLLGIFIYKNVTKEIGWEKGPVLVADVFLFFYDLFFNLATPLLLIPLTKNSFLFFFKFHPDINPLLSK